MIFTSTKGQSWAEEGPSGLLANWSGILTFTHFTGLQQIEQQALSALCQRQLGRTFTAWRLRARRAAELRQRLRSVVYMMLMGRLAGAFDSWRRIASLLAHERHLVVLSVACLKHKVCFYRKRSCNMCKPMQTCREEKSARVLNNLACRGNRLLGHAPAPPSTFMHLCSEDVKDSSPDLLES